MTLKYDQWSELVGQTLKLQVGLATHRGTLVGLGQAVMAVGGGKVVRPWMIRTESGDIGFYPEDPSLTVVIDGE